MYYKIKIIKKTLLLLFILQLSFIFVNSNYGTGSSTVPPQIVRTVRTDNDANHILFVSTLDGGLTALDLAANGRTLWSQASGSAGPLLSQSLSKLEFSDSGVSYRLVPSLEGGLFRLDAQGLRSLPLTADSLLSASFRLADDSVAVGGKEQRVRLVDTKHGNIFFSCDGRGGCEKIAEKAEASNNENGSGVLMIKRQSSTVRALHLRSGEERWNFSVGHLELIYIPCDSSNEKDNPSSMYSRPAFEHCRNTQGSGAKPAIDGENLEEVVLAFDVPRGRVSGRLGGSVPKTKEPWSTDLSSPICKAWELRGNELKEISIFDMKRPSKDPSRGPSSPLIYFGADANREQYYVQVEQVGKRKPGADPAAALGKVIHARWQHYAGSSPSRTPLIHAQIEGKPPTSTTPRQHGSGSEVALREGQMAPYPFEEGYYIVGELEKSHKRPSRDDDFGDFEDDYWDFNIIYHNGTLWHWWKQVLVIALLASVITHLVIVKFIYRRNPSELVARADSNTSGIGSMSEEPSLPELPGLSNRSRGSTSVGTDDGESTCSTQPADAYVSTYQDRFQHLSCLGRGGFGVVFEAKNKMDDVLYAVKRIGVRNSSSNKERILREVKALARLDHGGIVRYYQAWFETPPLGWQEEQDRLLISACAHPEDGMTSLTSEDIAEMPLTEPFPEPHSPVRSPEKLTWKLPQFTLGSISDEVTQSSSGVSEDCVPLHNYADDSLDIVFEDSKPRSTQSKSDSYDIQFRNSTTTPGAVTSAGSGADSQVPDSAPKLYLYIQMQLCQRHSLKEWLSKNTLNRNREDMMDIFYQIGAAVDYVHECDLIHRDLKPSNIFFAADGSVRVGDFGLVTAIEEGKERRKEEAAAGDTPRALRHTSRVGTELYMSPEQQRGSSYDEKVDIYSLGLILLELLYPFGTENERARVLADARRQTLPDRFVRELKKESELVMQLICENSTKRPSSREVMDHPLVKSADKGRASRQRYRSISTCSSENAGK